MAQINIELKDYVNAKDGSLLIKKNGKSKKQDVQDKKGQEKNTL